MGRDFYLWYGSLLLWGNRVYRKCQYIDSKREKVVRMTWLKLRCRKIKQLLIASRTTLSHISYKFDDSGTKEVR